VKKQYFMIGMLILGMTLLIFLYSKSPVAQESITFFPIAEDVTFKNAGTSLSLARPQTLVWKIDSTLDRKSYLRQDAGFLFSKGRLVSELGDWKQNTDRLKQEKQITIKDNTLLQAITFHQAEIHDKSGQIYSAQSMSEDQLYVAAPKSAPAYSFRTPKTKEQQQIRQQLDEQTERMLQYSWNKGVRHYSIRLGEYQAYPLNQFDKRAKSGLPGYSKKETDRIIGQLWEGLYKNYFLGIKKADGTNINPMGSTLPLILIANNKSHLLVLTETANGEPILLRQMIQ
jgi:hypothetical protein